MPFSVMFVEAVRTAQDASLEDLRCLVANALTMTLAR